MIRKIADIHDIGMVKQGVQLRQRNALIPLNADIGKISGPVIYLHNHYSILRHGQRQQELALINNKVTVRRPVDSCIRLVFGEFSLRLFPCIPLNRVYDDLAAAIPRQIQLVYIYGKFLSIPNGRAGCAVFTICSARTRRTNEDITTTRNRASTTLNLLFILTPPFQSPAISNHHDMIRINNHFPEFQTPEIIYYTHYIMRKPEIGHSEVKTW